MSLPFYKKMWFIILMLILFAPIGIVLLWLFGSPKQTSKIILSIIFGIFFLIVAIPKGGTEPTDSQILQVSGYNASSIPGATRSLKATSTHTLLATSSATPIPTIKETTKQTPVPAKPTVKSTPKPNVQQTTRPETETTVYITNTGTKYHRSSCRYVKESKSAVTVSWAKEHGYTPCGVCKPPQN